MSNSLVFAAVVASGGAFDPEESVSVSRWLLAVMVVVIGIVGMGMVTMVRNAFFVAVVERFVPDGEPARSYVGELRAALVRAAGWAIVMVLAPVVSAAPYRSADGDIADWGVVVFVLAVLGPIAIACSALTRVTLPSHWRRLGLPKDSLGWRAVALLVIWGCAVIRAVTLDEAPLSRAVGIGVVLAVLCVAAAVLPAWLGDRRRAAAFASRPQAPPTDKERADLAEEAAAAREFGEKWWDKERWAGVLRAIGWSLILTGAGMASRHLDDPNADRGSNAFTLPALTAGVVACVYVAWFRHGMKKRWHARNTPMASLGLRVAAEIGLWGSLALVIWAGRFVPHVVPYSLIVAGAVLFAVAAVLVVAIVGDRTRRAAQLAQSRPQGELASRDDPSCGVGRGPTAS